MIAAICSVKNEADIIESSIRHLMAQGVCLFEISDGMSTDGTRDILAKLANETGDRLRWSDDNSEYFYQAKEMNRLADRVTNRRDYRPTVDWIVPFDADEFIYATEGGTVAEALEAQPDDVRKLYLRMYQQLTIDHRAIAPKPLPKVVFRPTPGAQLTMGQHDVSIEGPRIEGVLDLKELQYRSFEHFCRKIRSQFATLDPSLPESSAAHIRRLAPLSDEQMLVEWNKLCETESIFDPLPL